MFWNLVKVYWLGALPAGLLMMSGFNSPRVSALVASAVPTANAVIKTSQDPSFVGSYAAFCLCWSLFLMLASFKLLRGSHVTFVSRRKKTAFVTGAALMFAATVGTLFVVEPTAISPTGGRGLALLWVGTRSTVAAIPIFGGSLGFAQFFFFICLKVAATGRFRA